MTQLAVLEIFCRMNYYIMIDFPSRKTKQMVVEFYAKNFSKDLLINTVLPDGIDLLVVNNRNTRTRCEICSPEYVQS